MKNIILILFLFNCVHLFGDTTWVHLYSGKMQEYANCIETTKDSNIIIGGITDSFGFGGLDLFVLKLDPLGNIIFQNVYGTDKDEFLNSILQAKDGSLILLGNIIEQNNCDGLILKLNSIGETIWQKRFGSNIEGESFIKAIETYEGNYIILAEAYDKMIILCISSNGNLIWEKNIGPLTFVSDMKKANFDDGFIITGFYEGSPLIVKFKYNGLIEWQMKYSGLGYFNSIERTIDNGFILTKDYYTACPAESINSSLDDYNVLKIDYYGNIEWAKYYEIYNNPFKASFIRGTKDNGYIIFSSMDTCYPNDANIEILKINNSGEIQWGKIYGNSDNLEEVFDIKETEDGGFLIAGYDIIDEQEDSLIYKINSNGELDPTCNFVNDLYLNEYDVTPSANPVSLSIDSTQQFLFDSNLSKTVSELDLVNLCQCGEPIIEKNNNAFDLDCSDTGVKIAWEKDPKFWQDGGIGKRSYDVLRNGIPIAENIPYGIDYYIDNSGDNFLSYNYSIKYNNGCGFSSLTEGLFAEDWIGGKQPAQISIEVFDLDPNFDTGVKISWSPPDDWGDYEMNINNRRYNLYRNSELLKTLSSESLNWVDNTGSNNIQYEYHLEVVNGCQFSSVSEPAFGVDFVKISQNLWFNIYSIPGCELTIDKLELADDGGYIIGGKDFCLSKIFLIKLNSEGNVEWKNAFQMFEESDLLGIKKTNDGYIILGSYYQSYDYTEIYIFKLNFLGEILWQKLYNLPLSYNIQFDKTNDNGFILLGKIESDYPYFLDFFLLKIDYMGNIEWAKEFKDYFTYNFSGLKIKTLRNDGYILVGSISTLENDFDILILKLDSIGNLSWIKKLGTSYYEDELSIFQTEENGFFLAGNSFHPINYSFLNSFIIKINSEGETNFQRYYNKTINFLKKLNGGYIATFYDSDMMDQFWILKFDSNDNSEWQKGYKISNEYWIPSDLIQGNDNGYFIVGCIISISNYDVSGFGLKITSSGDVSPNCNFLNGDPLTEISGNISDKNVYFDPIIVDLSISENSTTIPPSTFDLDISNICSCSTPLPFNLIFPENNSNTPNSSLTFDWADSENSNYYNIFLGTTNPPELFQNNITESQLLISNLLQNNKYYWYVESVNDCGSTSSDVWSFLTSNLDCLNNLGDVNMNARITTLDASLILEYLSGSISLNEDQFCRADVNINGQISSMDASLIIQCSIGLCSNLPPDFLNSCTLHSNCN